MAGENINRRLNIYINDKEVVNSMSGITREMTKTRNELKHLNKNSEDYDAEVKRLTKHLGDLAEKQNEFKDELKLTNKEMGAAQENFSNLLGGLATGDMKAVQDGMMGIRGSIVETAKAGWAFVATPIGAMIVGLVGFAMAAKAVFDFNEEIRESNRLLDSLGVDTKIRPAIQGIVDTYKVGFEDLANAIDNMVDLGLVKNEFEALEQIKEGLSKAPDANAFLSMLDANGIAAKNLGLQLQDVIDLNESFEASGANAQAIFGALQKSSSTLILQSPQLKKSLENAFGSSFTNELLSQVKSGSITYYDALDKIHKKGEAVGISNQKQAQLAKDLFGKSSIAAGGYEMILGNVSAAQGKHNKELTETQKQVKALAESNIALEQAMDDALKSEGWNAWKNNALIAMNSLKAGFFSFIHDISSTRKDARNEANTSSKTSTLDYLNTFKDPKEKEKNAQLTKDDAIKWIKEYNNELLKAKHSYELFNEVSLKNFTPQNIKNREQATADIEKYNRSLGTQKGRLIAAQSILEESVIKQHPKTTPDGPSDEDKKAAADAAKKRAKELADAQKHSEDLLKQEADLQKQLLDTKRAADDLKFGLIQDDYTRERDLLNSEYDRKIQDLQNNIKKEQEAIEKLKAGIASPKSSSEDIASFKRQLADRKVIQENYNSQLISLEATRDLKLGALHEKFLKEDQKKQEEANARELQNLQTRNANELNSIASLEEAKAMLSNYLTEDELAKVTNLESAKKKIKEQFQKEEFALQQKHLVDMMAQVQAIFAQEQLTGIQLITPEEREVLLKFLDDAAAKLAALGVTDPNADKKKDKKDLSHLSGVDILGFSPQQWDDAFANLDNIKGKIEAVEIVAGAMKNAFGKFFEFLDAGDQKSLNKFKKNTDNKKKALTDQLERGYITQEVYTARMAKLDQEMEKKQAELEYKKAKREKISAALQIVVQTGIAVMKAIAGSPMTFGLPWSAVIAGMGAINLAGVLAAPLPPKSGFKDGGYTGDGPVDSSPGPVHYKEYVIPEKVLFGGDPIMPDIVNYVEAKRKGKSAAFGSAGSGDDSMPSINSKNNSNDSQNTNALVVLVSRTTAVLEKLEKDGLQSYLVNDIKAAKKMKEKIKELETLKSKAKP